MFSHGRPPLLSPLCGEDAKGSCSPEVAALWRRATFGWALHYAGLSAIVAAAGFALVGIPMPVFDLPPVGVEVTAPPPVSVELAPPWVWFVRIAAIGGLVANLVGILLDGHYSREVLLREDGEDSRGELLAPSLVPVALAAGLALLVVVLYQGA